MSSLAIKRSSKIKEWFYSRILETKPKSTFGEVHYEEVEVKSLNENGTYPEWTRVSRFLACGLIGVVVRELDYEE